MSAAPAQTEYDSRIAGAAIDILGMRNLRGLRLLIRLRNECSASFSATLVSRVFFRVQITATHQPAIHLLPISTSATPCT
jgi:hypothetical protein